MAKYYLSDRQAIELIKDSLNDIEAEAELSDNDVKDIFSYKAHGLDGTMPYNRFSGPSVYKCKMVSFSSQYQIALSLENIPDSLSECAAEVLRMLKRGLIAEHSAGLRDNSESLKKLIDNDFHVYTADEIDEGGARISFYFSECSGHVYQAFQKLVEERDVQRFIDLVYL